MSIQLNDFLHDALDKIAHTSSVEAFYHQFQAIKSLLSASQPDIPEAYFATRFAYGLLPEFQAFVLRFTPVTVMAAYRLALIHEESIYLDYFPESENNGDNSSTKDGKPGVINTSAACNVLTVAIVSNLGDSIVANASPVPMVEEEEIARVEVNRVEQLQVSSDYEIVDSEAVHGLENSHHSKIAQVVIKDIKANPPDVDIQIRDVITSIDGANLWEATEVDILDDNAALALTTWDTIKFTESRNRVSVRQNDEEVKEDANTGNEGVVDIVSPSQVVLRNDNIKGLMNKGIYLHLEAQVVLSLRWEPGPVTKNLANAYTLEINAVLSSKHGTLLLSEFDNILILQGINSTILCNKWASKDISISGGVNDRELPVSARVDADSIVHDIYHPHSVDIVQSLRVDMIILAVYSDGLNDVREIVSREYALRVIKMCLVFIIGASCSAISYPTSGCGHDFSNLNTPHTSPMFATKLDLTAELYLVVEVYELLFLQMYALMISVQITQSTRDNYSKRRFYLNGVSIQAVIFRSVGTMPQQDLINKNENVLLNASLSVTYGNAVILRYIHATAILILQVCTGVYPGSALRLILQWQIAWGAYPSFHMPLTQVQDVPETQNFSNAAVEWSYCTFSKVYTAESGWYCILDILSESDDHVCEDLYEPNSRPAPWYTSEITEDVTSVGIEKAMPAVHFKQWSLCEELYASVHFGSQIFLGWPPPARNPYGMYCCTIGRILNYGLIDKALSEDDTSKLSMLDGHGPAYKLWLSFQYKTEILVQFGGSSFGICSSSKLPAIVGCSDKRSISIDCKGEEKTFSTAIGELNRSTVSLISYLLHETAETVTKDCDVRTDNLLGQFVPSFLFQSTCLEYPLLSNDEVEHILVSWCRVFFMTRPMTFKHSGLICIAEIRPTKFMDSTVDSKGRFQQPTIYISTTDISLLLLLHMQLLYMCVLRMLANISPDRTTFSVGNQNENGVTSALFSSLLEISINARLLRATNGVLHLSDIKLPCSWYPIVGHNQGVKWLISLLSVCYLLTLKTDDPESLEGSPNGTPPQTLFSIRYIFGIDPRILLSSYHVMHLPSVRLLWLHRSFILVTTWTFMIFGWFIAWSTPKGKFQLSQANCN